jgi:hypothetical protein
MESPSIRLGGATQQWALSPSQDEYNAKGQARCPVTEHARHKAAPPHGLATKKGVEQGAKSTPRT